jgi:Zn-dependent peptidase ImmA (M78 family)
MGFIQELGREAPDYRYVLKEVDRILKENTIIEPPVLPREIAENYGIKVLFAQFPENLSQVMGFFDFERDQIIVNSTDPANRQTFTIAHELGHAIMHKAYLKDNQNAYKVLLRQPMAAQKDPIEQEANSFAANLLVPRKMLEQYHKLAGVRELSRLFIVSEDVIRWRLVFEKFVPAYAPKEG